MSTALALASSATRPESSYGIDLVERDGFFYDGVHVEGIAKMYPQFKVRENDVFVCSGMKTGTTWLKSIVASIMSESKGNVLKGKNAHDLIPTIEETYSSLAMPDAATTVSEMPSPRLLGSHLLYSALPPQITSLGCRIIYIVRNPKDTFVSHWKFLAALQTMLTRETTSPVPKEVFFDSFVNGVSLYGPFADHVLGF